MRSKGSSRDGEEVLVDAVDCSVEPSLSVVVGTCTVVDEVTELVVSTEDADDVAAGDEDIGLLARDTMVLSECEIIRFSVVNSPAGASKVVVSWFQEDGSRHLQSEHPLYCAGPRAPQQSPPSHPQQ